jgi:hypothetical protein
MSEPQTSAVPDQTTPLGRARQAMIATGQWDSSQAMGRSWPIGCVALEITQRCNLDCTACYLSEYSEAVKDLPLEEVFRRIDMIHTRYGAHTNVQVTGGDPTLRRREELLAIVRRLRALGMRPSLLTNGIRASRELLGSRSRLDRRRLPCRHHPGAQGLSQRRRAQCAPPELYRAGPAACRSRCSSTPRSATKTSISCCRCRRCQSGLIRLINNQRKST